MIFDCRCGFRTHIDIAKIDCKKSGYRVKCANCGHVGKFKGLSPIRCIICKRNPYDYYYVNKSMVCVKCR